jgi:hypothetical protein
MVYVTLASCIFGRYAEGLGDFVELFVTSIREFEISLGRDDSIRS